MPKSIRGKSKIRPGLIYEDTAFHPCLCIKVDGGFASGISLIDGSYPRDCDLFNSGIRLLTPAEAWEWKMRGPDEVAAQWRRERGIDDDGNEIEGWIPPEE